MIIPLLNMITSSQKFLMYILAGLKV